MKQDERHHTSDDFFVGIDLATRLLLPPEILTLDLDRFKPGFPIWLWYFWPSDQSSRLDCRGFPEKKQATEGDTQWVNYRPSPFSSRSTDF